MGRRVLGGLGEIAVIVVGALIISTLLRSFVAQMFVIPSGSMENTLQIGDRVLVSKFGGFQRGDVVVFADPGTWLPATEKESTPVEQALEFVGVLPNSGEEYLIKRVIGMPGDRVKCCTAEGAVSVNGVALDESSYLYTESGVQVAPSSVTFDVVVPKDHVFVMGDHRNSSADSRCRLEQAGPDGNQGSAAFVPTNKVVGAAVSVVAPLDRLATFRVPQTYSTVPAPEDSPPDKAIIIEAPPGC
ncbi:signal peptidase I [Arachnia propionica]|uniref:Signal peptidase I n=1 Tax=Arachnia propionica TaxID=1750 RepID=A0A3P1T3C1_9ACTN|nr:signal peptidase I [Arachnia propionica]